MKELEENNMRYLGFSTRDYLILENLRLGKNLSILEIGCGLGSIIDMVVGKVKEYYGVDIAFEVINYLNLLYKDNDSVNLYCLDVCKNSSFLNKKFDVIFSTDTLEHVESPQGYFNFIKKHLKSDGVALITYPNESKDKHHGITWFNYKQDLLEIIDRGGLKVDALVEVKKTLWHSFIKKFLWKFPKLIISRQKGSPQTFEQTEAFKIAKSTGIRTNVFTFYATAVTKLAAIFPLYRYVDIGENITNKNLFIHLKHK